MALRSQLFKISGNTNHNSTWNCFNNFYFDADPFQIKINYRKLVNFLQFPLLLWSVCWPRPGDHPGSLDCLLLWPTQDNAGLNTGFRDIRMMRIMTDTLLLTLQSHLCNNLVILLISFDIIVTKITTLRYPIPDY